MRTHDLEHLSCFLPVFESSTNQARMVIISQDVDVGWRSLNVSLELMVATYVLDFEDRRVDDPKGRLEDTSHEACLSHQYSV